VTIARKATGCTQNVFMSLRQKTRNLGVWKGHVEIARRLGSRKNVSIILKANQRFQRH
jgi:hypothetical protein